MSDNLLTHNLWLQCNGNTSVSHRHFMNSSRGKTSIPLDPNKIYPLNRLQIRDFKLYSKTDISRTFGFNRNNYNLI